MEQEGGINCAGITGLTDGTYQIIETKAPAGYNMISTPISFTVANANANFTKSDTVIYVVADNTLKIGNTSGTELPSTGAAGTQIYTVTGIFLIALAGVILVSRKKRKV